MIVDALTVDVDDFETATGWRLRPEGACRGEVCVPLPPEAVVDGRVDVGVVAARTGMPIVRDDEHGVGALGPWSGNGRALPSATAPELVLPDLDGEPFALSSLRGQKVLLLAWAPY
jgi:hypothetical protein